MNNTITITPISNGYLVAQTSTAATSLGQTTTYCATLQAVYTLLLTAYPQAAPTAPAS